MITLIIHDTKNAATKDVAKKHKRRFFNMTQFLTGGGANRKNKLSSKLKKHSINKEESKEVKIDDDEDENKSKVKNKNKKNKGKYTPSNSNKGKEEERGRYTVPLHDESSGNVKENKKKINLIVPENKKEEVSMTSSIVPLINGNPLTSFDTKDSKDFSFTNSNSNPSSGSNPSNSRPNSNKGDEEPSKVEIKEDIKEEVKEGSKGDEKISEMESDQIKMFESPKMEEQLVVYESPKEIGPSEINHSIDLFTTSNLTSSMTIKKFYQDNPSSVGKPLASIFENPESGQIYDGNKDVHPPTSASASTSNPNLNNASSDIAKSKPKTTFKSLPVPNSAGSGSNSETENENTIFDYNAYKKNANNKNYIVGMLKQHYQTCLDEIEYVKKREKTLNSLKSGFEKGIMALQTM